MSDQKETRWEQRFSNYEKALQQLQEVAALGSPNKFEEHGLVKAFEFTYELAWNTLRDFLVHQGFVDIVGSRDAIRMAFNQGLISEGRVWMRMIESRNKTSRTYNEKTAKEIVSEVREQFLPHFMSLKETLSQRLGGG